MKLAFSIAFCALALVIAACEDGAWTRTFYPDGKPWSELRREHGSLNGDSRVWHSNGSVAREGAHLDGHRHGTWHDWTPDGVLLLERVYERGRLNGPSRSWHSNGAPKAFGAFRDGARHDRWSEYFEDGSVAVISNYEAGARHGDWRSWLRDGTFSGGAHYESGKFIGKLAHTERPAAADRALYAPRAVR